MKCRKHSDETVANMVALRSKGHSIREVRALAKVRGLGAVHTYVKDVPLPFGPLKRGPRKKIAFNVCKTLQDQGLGVRAIARKIGCAPSAVSRTLKTGKAAA